MSSRKLTVRFGLIVTSMWMLTAAVSADTRLGDRVVPTSQTVRLKLDPRQSDYTGSVSIGLEVVEKTDRFRFHSESQELVRVVLRGPGGAVESTYGKEGEDVVVVRTEAPLEKGEYTLEIDFKSSFGTQVVGLYRAEVDGLSYAFTQFQPDDAREAFPCWDEPGFKIPYQMTLTVPEGHLALTNTPVDRETSSDGFRTVTFRRTKPLPSYLLAIATGPLETVELPGLGVPARIVTVKGQSHLTGIAAAMTPPLLEALEEYFGSPYPFAKLDLVAVPDFWPGGMENAGAITFTDRSVLKDPETISIHSRRRMATLIAHELAHMWFGDLVTMEWWDDLWLNESFASWLAEKIAHQVFPELDLDVLRVQDVQIIFWQDAWAKSEPIRRPVESVKSILQGFDLAYFKGSMVLGMFEQWLGPEVFRQGVRAYLEANAWGNATASDLWRALDEVSSKPVSAAMTTFIEQAGFPRIDVEILDDGRAEVSQERFRNFGGSSPDLLWKVPVTLKYQLGDGSATRTVFLDKPSLTVDLGLPEGGRPAWIYPNAEGRGYFRWRVAPRHLHDLAENAGSALAPRERIELLGNMTALLRAGTVGADVHLEVLASLAGDPDPLVGRAVLAELELVKKALIPSRLEAAFARYVRRTLRPALERIGMEPKPGEDEAITQLRPELMYSLGDLGRDELLFEHGRSLAKSYLADADSIDPSLVTVALVLAAMDGDVELFEEYRKRFEAAKTPTERWNFHAALGSFGDTALRKKALRYAIEGSMDADELVSFGYGALTSDEGWELMYRWYVDNYEEIVERIPPVYVASMATLAGGCSLERLKHAQEFFAKPEHQAPGSDKEIEKAAERVVDCVRRRQREGERVSKYLLAQ